MENFDYAIVEEAAKQLYIKALCDLPPDVREALKKAYARETQPAARSIFEAMFKAIEIADTKKTLLCQDTGLPIYKVKIGS
ncbi:fumarate hydratase, partial [Bilophila wadsworthia]